MSTVAVGTVRAVRAAAMARSVSVRRAVVLRAEKAQVIDDLHAVFDETGVVVVTHYKGLSVAEITDLRARMRAAGASFRVTKNKLAQRAVEGTPFADLSPLFKGPTAIAFSKDPTAAPKIVAEFAQEERQAADRRRRPQRHAAGRGVGPGPGRAAFARRVAGQADRPAARRRPAGWSGCCRRRAAGGAGPWRQRGGAAGRLSA